MQVDLSVLKTPITIDIENDDYWVDYLGKDIRNEIVMKLYKKNFYFNASKKDSSNLKIFIISGEKEDFLIDKYKEKYKDKNIINIFGDFDYIKKEVENYLSLRNII